MADELEILTENAAGTGWVDLSPGAESTGYQAQNTNIESNRNGIDSSYVRWDSGTSEIVIEESGPIDDNGVPFAVKNEIRLADPGAGTWYLKVVAGSTILLRSIEVSASKGTWDGSKNGLYVSGDRVLNWVVVQDGSGTVLAKLLPLKVGNLEVENDLNVSNDLTVENDLNVNNDLTVTGGIDSGGTLLKTKVASASFSGATTVLIAHGLVRNNIRGISFGTTAGPAIVKYATTTTTIDVTFESSASGTIYAVIHYIE